MKQFKTESKRILDLMINSIYTNKEIFLRELISNASDAIDKMKFLSLTDSEIGSNFEINISVDKENKVLTVEDNGIGMTREELEKNLGTIAESGTLNFKKENDVKGDEALIGQFGVGFYSAFMVAKKVEVFTRAYKSETAYKWTSSGASGYEIEETEKPTVGTTIVITLKDDDDDCKYSKFADEYEVSNLVKQYSDYIRYPIKMMRTRSKKKEDSDEYEEYSEIETLNSMVPIWKKPKSEVTDENIDEFYKNTFHDYEKPLKSIYAKIEGMVNYDAMLFIPSRAPYDYYSKDYKKGLKLFCNGVMIMEKCEDLLPDYFGFVRGIVDSSDLSLNISREMLQKDRQVKAIATSLEKKIIQELKKMLEDDRENYEKMFKEFGLSIKFGMYNDFGAKKDSLKDLVLFYSSEKKKPILLSEYVSAVKEGQESIYYACGDSYENIDKLPQVEKVKDKGFEILYLKDGVDEFVVKILESVDGKKFKSVQLGDLGLDSEDEKKELNDKADKAKEMLELAKTTLEGKVKDVKLSNQLKSYPACLSASGEISIEMEKVLNSMPNAQKNFSADKVLELNAEHKVFEKLSAVFETDKELFKKYITVLYEGARMLEGLPVENVPEYVGTVSELLS